MKFILELDAKETRELIKEGILESIIKKLEGGFGEKEEVTETHIAETKPKKKEEVKEVVEEKKEKKEKKDEVTETVKTKSTISPVEFKERLVALTKDGKKDLVKKVLLDKGYGRVSAVKEEDFADILKELS